MGKKKEVNPAKKPGTEKALPGIVPAKSKGPILPIEECIMILRDKQVMIDRDLAMLYGVEVKRLNEQVRRNTGRFPDRFRFQLTDNERHELVANCDRFMVLKHSTVNPYAFTEQGIGMLSDVLNSQEAIKTSIQIMDAFVAMRRFFATYAELTKRVMDLETRQIAAKLDTDQKFELVFKAIEANEVKPKQGIFFDGEVFDAYVMATRIIKSAKKSIILIDNYVDESVITVFGKKASGVKVTILTPTISRQLALDIQRANTQYPVIEAKTFSQSHDRFLIVDETDIYLLGASLKDLGKKWFGFAQLSKESITSVFERFNGLI
jgi:hypothetical protein